MAEFNYQQLERSSKRKASRLTSSNVSTAGDKEKHHEDVMGKRRFNTADMGTKAKKFKGPSPSSEESSSSDEEAHVSYVERMPKIPATKAAGGLSAKYNPSGCSVSSMSLSNGANQHVFNKRVDSSESEDEDEEDSDEEDNEESEDKDVDMGIWNAKLNEADCPARGMTLKKILRCFQVKGETFLIVKWKNCKSTDAVKLHDMQQLYSNLVLEYFEQLEKQIECQMGS